MSSSLPPSSPLPTTTNPPEHDPPTLSALSIASWNANAAYWDTTITAHGNKYWRRLQEPSLVRLLTPALSQPGSRALDLATGNGLCARWMARQGAHDVLATDASGEMLALARGHCEGSDAGEDKGIRFRQVDVTSREELEALREEEGPFGVVLMNMAAMDVAELGVLAEGLGRGGLLAEGGVFVATVLHPVFFTSGASKNIQVRYDAATGEQVVERTLVIKEYMDVPPALGIAVPGQPEKQLYFHRPMHELFAIFFKVGLVMDAMEELAFTAEDAQERIESSSNYTQLPAILAFRMRLP